MRNKIEIRVWMLKKSLTVTDIYKELNFRNHTPVSLTLAGHKNNRKVLRLLLDKGCPAKYLDLPKDMRRAA
jgi:hypothetical protein